MTANSVPAFTKAIDFDRETCDFRLSLDGEFVGYAKSYYEGELKLDALAFNRLREERQAVRDEVDARAAADAAAEQAEADAWLSRTDPAMEAEQARYDAEQIEAQARDRALTEAERDANMARDRDAVADEAPYAWEAVNWGGKGEAPPPPPPEPDAPAVAVLSPPSGPRGDGGGAMGYSGPAGALPAFVATLRTSLADAVMPDDGAVWLREGGRCVLVTPPTRYNTREVREAIEARLAARAVGEVTA